MYTHIVFRTIILTYCMHDFIPQTETQNCTINVHLLQHLVHYVHQYGPLWTHSCFPFEGLNGRLLKMYHGTQYVALQVPV